MKTTLHSSCTNLEEFIPQPKFKVGDAVQHIQGGRAVGVVTMILGDGNLRTDWVWPNCVEVYSTTYPERVLVKLVPQTQEE